MTFSKLRPKGETLEILKLRLIPHFSQVAIRDSPQDLVSCATWTSCDSYFYAATEYPTSGSAFDKSSKQFTPILGPRHRSGGFHGSLSTRSDEVTLRTLLHACQESRTEAEVHYQQLFADGMRHSVFLDPTIDSLYFADVDAVGSFFTEVYHHTTLVECLKHVEQVQLLCPACYHQRKNKEALAAGYRYWLNSICQILEQFGNIKSLTLVSMLRTAKYTKAEQNVEIMLNVPGEHLKEKLKQYDFDEMEESQRNIRAAYDWECLQSN
ncbi:hypothetical protein BDZ45DRAFT_693023 [Acephala macrosclerotiorum]|nr:hypothetical protein BDZ45DRAFT_693023 [Acephala macrosclerotiorum]